MMPLPTPPLQFDMNEWFVLAASLVVFAAIASLPRKLSWTEISIVWIFNIYLATMADFILAIPPDDLYDINDSPKLEWFDLYVYATLYPGTAYILLTVYEMLKPQGRRMAAYLLGWALLTVGLEWTADRFQLFHYTDWHLTYSFPVYVAVYAINLRLLTYVRRSIRADWLTGS